MITAMLAILGIHMFVAYWLFIKHMGLKISKRMWKRISANLPFTLIHKMAGGPPNPSKNRK
jgi:hypothetical protein